jgi:hypothetical protein
MLQIKSIIILFVKTAQSNLLAINLLLIINSSFQPPVKGQHKGNRTLKKRRRIISSRPPFITSGVHQQQQHQHQLLAKVCFYRITEKKIKKK